MPGAVESIKTIGMGEKRIINLQVGSLLLPVRIDKDDQDAEEVFRKAAKLITIRMQEYQKKFADQGIFDILAMTSLEMAVELYKCKNGQQVAIDFEVAGRISQKLDDILEA
jgi:hypothetical protein